MTQRNVDSLVIDFAARIRARGDLPVVHKAYGTKQLVGHEAPVEPPEEPLPKPVLSQAKTERIEDILFRAAREAMTRIDRMGRTAQARHYIEAFCAAIEQRCSLILDAASKKNMLKHVEDQRLALSAELKSKREAERKKLVSELRFGRRKLRELKDRCVNVERDLARAQARIRPMDGAHYPSVPPAVLAPHKEAEGLPSEPGIYFLWRGDIIEYVGKSIRLSGRLKLGNHHVMKPEHRISYVLLDAKQLTWAECYYIGALRPYENFGRSASHYEGTT